MADVLTFTNPKWVRLEPLYTYSYEILVILDWLECEVPRQHLSVFEHKWLDRMAGYRNREVFNYLNETRDFYDARVTQAIYGKTVLPEMHPKNA